MPTLSPSPSAEASPSGTTSLLTSTFTTVPAETVADLYKGTAGAAIASAATVDLGAATGNTVHITGTTAITSFGTAAAGVERTTIFDAALTLTHNATSLILPGGVSITTAAGDTARFVSEGSGNWRCTAYARASGMVSRSPAIQSITSTATITPTFSDDMVKVTGLAVNATLANPTGTAIPGLGMVIRIKDNGTTRTLSYDTKYRAIGVTLPTSTTPAKTTYLAMIYNSDDDEWDVVAAGTEA